MLDNLLSLDKMKIGDIGVVKKINTKGDIKRRLLDIGLIEGTRVESLMKSPAGDPIAYLIRGAVIAIRSDDTKDIIVKPL